MKMEKEMTPNEKRPQQDCGGMFAQVQASVEILSPVPVSGKCSEKDYERLFIRDPEVKAREGKMAYVRPEYHERIMNTGFRIDVSYNEATDVLTFSPNGDYVRVKPQPENPTEE